MNHDKYEARGPDSPDDSEPLCNQPDFMQLEDRLLYSAVPLDLSAEDLDSDDLDYDEAHSDLAEIHDEPSELYKRVLSAIESPEFLDEFGTPELDENLELIFIDSSLHDADQLIADLLDQANDGRNLEIVLLDSSRDGVDQITSALSFYENLSSVHIVSHGSDGAVQLGGSKLSADTVSAYAGDIVRWQDALADDADFLFYGCDLAGSDSGIELLEALGSLCNCDVAASDDLTGHADLGGDWDLEYVVGLVDTDQIFSVDVQQNWRGTLETVTVSNTTDVANGTTTSIAALIANDGGDGISLREAIIAANNTANVGAPDEIHFALTGNPNAAYEITVPVLGLPAIQDAVVLDASTQTALDGSYVVLNGADATIAEGVSIQSGGSGSTIRGFSIVGTLGGIGVYQSNDNVIEGNFIGYDPSGTVTVTGTQSSNGILIQDSDGNTIDGNTIVYAGNSGIAMTSGADNNVIINNYIGTDSVGTDRGNGNSGIGINGTSANNVVGRIGEGNTIAYNGGDGVYLWSTAGDGNSIRGNSIHSNDGLGIDLQGGFEDGFGVTDNDLSPTVDADSGPNELQNYPTINSADSNGSATTIDFDVLVDNSDESYVVDFYSSPTVDPSGHGEGRIYLGSYATGPISGNNNYSIVLPVAVVPGEFVSATTTRAPSGGGFFETSEFAQSVQATGVAPTFTISGNVFDDVDGDGDLADAVGVQNVWVGLYEDGGDGFADGVDDTLVDWNPTAADGSYSFADLTDERTYWVVVESATVRASAGLLTGAAHSETWGEQTYATAGAVQYDGSTYSYSSSAGALFGGKQVNVSDDIAALGTSEHIIRANVSGGDVADVDFGFSFNTITTTLDGDDDSSNPRTVQGSLRQFIQNSNALLGIQSSKFRLALEDVNHLYYQDNAGAGFSAAVTTTLDDASITDFDADYVPGTARSWWRFTPQSNLPALTDTFILDGTTQTGFTNAPIIEIDGTNIASGDPNALTVETYYSTIRGLVINNTPDDAIEVDNHGGYHTIAGNYIGTDVSGLLDLGNGYGITIKSSNNTIGGANEADRNVIGGNDALSDSFGLGFWQSASANLVIGNFIGVGADGTTALGNRVGVEFHNSATNNTLGTPGYGNVIANSSQDGVLVTGNSGTVNTIRGNSIFDNAGLGINLDGGSENSFGVTANDTSPSVDADSGPNNLQNFATITSATSNSQTTEVSFNINVDNTDGSYIVDFYSSPTVDSSGHGEGAVYLGSYATGAISGSNNFAIVLPTSVTAGHSISATTTVAPYAGGYQETSEFSAARNVTADTQASTDLDANDSSGATGGDFNTAFVTGMGPINIADSDAIVVDLDGTGATTYSRMDVKITNLLDGVNEVLDLDVSSHPGFLASYNPTFGTLVITGSGTKAQYEAALRDVTYDNTAATPDTTTRVVSVEITDGSGFGTMSYSNIAITSVNAPTDLSSGIEFNTDGGNDAYLISDSSLSQNLTATTVEIRFAGSDTTDEPVLISLNNGSEDILSIQWNSTHNGLELDFGTTLPPHANIAKSELFDGQIHTVSVTWDQVNGDWEFYLDGTLRDFGTGLNSGSAINTTSGQFVFGQEQDGDNSNFDPMQSFSGTFYDVRIWDHVRTSAEIDANQSHKLDVTPAEAVSLGLLANWQMDGFDAGTGKVVDIVSGNDLSVAHVSEPGFATSTTPVVDLNVDEHSAVGTSVGYVVPEKAENNTPDSYTFALLDDAGGRFLINSNGEILVADGSLLDYELATTHDITVEVVDSEGNAYSEVISILVNDVSGDNTAPTFGTVTDGILFPDYGGASDTNAIAVQPDGKLLTAGMTGNQFRVARHNPDGSLDSTFGNGNGYVVVPLSDEAFAESISVLADGRIVVTGTEDGIVQHVAVVVLLDDGSFDTNFSLDGQAVFGYSGSDQTSREHVVLGDGSIISVGTSNESGNTHMFVTTFSPTGTVTNSEELQIGTNSTATAVALHLNGKIYVTGHTGVGSAQDIVLARFNADGSIDTTFGGGNGYVIQAIGTNRIDYSNAIEIQADGRVVVAGRSWDGTTRETLVMRFLEDGTPDDSFNGPGNNGIFLSTLMLQAQDITIDSNGDYLLAGSVGFASAGDSAAMRISSSGVVDTSFGSSGTGVEVVAVSGGSDVAMSVDIQDDGTIVYANSVGGSLVQLTSDGVLDTVNFGSETTLGDTVSYTEGGSPVVLDADVAIFDAELSGVDDFGGATLTLHRVGGANGNDDFRATGSLSFGATSIFLSGVQKGTYSLAPAGQLTMTFDAGVTSAEVNEVMRQITYENLSNSPLPSVDILWTFNDGNSGAQGTGGALETTGTTTVNITAVNESPVVDLNGSDGASNDHTATFAEADGLLLVTDTDATITDPDHTDYQSISISLSGFANNADERIYVGGERFDFGTAEVSTVTVGTTTFNVDFDGTGFTIDNDGGGNVPQADLETLLRTISYHNTSQSAIAGDRIFLISVTDGAGQGSTVSTSTITVSTVEDAPIAVDDIAGLDFDGIDDFVQVADSASLTMTDAMTMEAWFRIESLDPTRSTLIINKEGEYELGVSSAGEIMWAFDNTAPNWNWHRTGYFINLNTWTHVAVTYDKVSDDAFINTYVNGNLVDSSIGSGSIGDQYPTMNELRIGGRTNNPADQFLDGQIDEVRIWNVARSQTDIQTNIDTNLVGNEAGLAGYWNFGEQSGTIANDLTSNGNDGTLIDGGAGTAGPQWTGYDVAANGSLTVSAAQGVLANDLDADGDAFSVISFDDAATLGSVTINTDGSLNYDPNGAFDALTAGQIAYDAVTYTLEDSNGNQDTATVRIQVIGVNDAPTIDLDADDSGGTPISDYAATFHEDGGPVVIVDNVDAVLHDVDSIVQSLTVTITNLLDGADESLAASAPASIGVNYNSATGILTLTNLGVATNSEFQTALRTITYHNVSNTPDITMRVIEFVVNDGSLDSSTATSTVTINTANDGPAFAGLDANPTFTEDAAAVLLDADVTVFDAELSTADNFSGSSLDIRRVGVVTAEDVFSHDPSSLLSPLNEGGNLVYNGVNVGTVNTNSGGILNITFNATATNSIVNSVMQSIAYTNSSDGPPASVQLNWTFNDGNFGPQGSGGQKFDSVQMLVSIIGVNDAPVLDNSVNPHFDTINEDQIGNGGETIASLLAKIGNPITDADSGAVEGIAVIINNGNGGTWQYSIDGGTNWLDVGAVNNANALLLRETDLLRMNPNGDNGDTSNIGFRAWDQTAGTVGTKVDISTLGGTGGTSAFSNNTLSAQIAVASINDAPVLNNTGTMSLTDVSEDELDPVGNSVSNVLSSAGFNAVTDVDDGSVEGIAVTGVDNSNGTWQYRVFATGSWTDIPPAVSDSSALLLYPSSELRFVPSADYNGPSGDITFRAWDRTSGTAGALVNASINGGTTAFSVDTETASLNILAVNDTPSLASIEGTALAYAENDGSVVITQTLTVSDPDGTLQSAIVAITSGYLSGEDSLTFVDQNGINGSWNSVNGTLTLSGAASVADYEAALRSITYTNSSDYPNETTRTVEFTVDDGAATSLSASRSIAVESINDDPSNSGSLPSSVTVTEDTQQPIDLSSFVLTDPDIDTQLLTVTLTSTTGGHLTAFSDFDVTVFGGGTSTLTLIGGLNDLNNFFSSPTRFLYQGATDLAGNGVDTINITASDGGSNGTGGGATILLGSVSVDITEVNDAPAIDLDADDSGGTTGSDFATTFVEDAGPIAIVDTADAILSDVDNTIQSLYVTITNLVSATAESLSATVPASIAVNYDSATGQLTLTNLGSATNAEFETALRSITYNNISQAPNTTPRTITFLANDGSADSNIATATVNITPVNDAPVLDNTTNPHFSSISEDQIGNGGETIGSLLAKVGDPITDPDSGALEGIAVIINNGNGGTWQYSIDGGVNWLDVGTVDNANALLLRDTDLLRMNPNGDNGHNSNIGFRAWDQTTGAAGAKVDIGALGGTGGTAAFSNFTLSAQIAVSDVNDAPALTGTLFTFDDVNEDDADPPGSSVTDMLASLATDSITDVDFGAVEGIAVSAVDNTNGNWQYSIDGGGNWINFGAVSQTNAIVLDESALVRFVPNAGYSGTSGDLAFFAWDQTDGSSNGDTGVSVFGQTGGTNAFSLVQSVASLNVVNVNDAPTIDLDADDSSGAAGNDFVTTFVPLGPSISIVDVDAVMADIDNANLQSLTVVLTNVQNPGDEAITASTAGTSLNMSTNSTATSVTVTISGDRPVAEYQQVLSTFQYANISFSPLGTDRIVTFVANDGAADSPVATTTIQMGLPPASAPMIDLDADDSSGATGNDFVTTFTEDGPAVRIADTDAVLSDIDTPTLDSLTVTITNLQDGALEVLTADTTATSISSFWNPATGVLSLTGTDSVANYEQVLRTIEYFNSDDDPGTVARVIEFVANDGALDSNVATATVNVTPVNDDPTLSGLSGPSSDFFENGAPIFLHNGLSVSDVDSFDFDGGSIVARINTNATTDDLLEIVVGGNVTLSGTDVLVSGVVVGTYAGGSGGTDLVVSLNANSTAASAAEVARQIAYSSTSENPDNISRNIGLTVTDGDGGTSPSAQHNITPVPVNDAPVVGNVENPALTYTENDGPVPITATLTLADVDDTHIESATVVISSGYVSGEDLLGFSSTPNITASWDAITATLTLTGTATVAEYEAALQNVEYENILESPLVGNRTVDFYVFDGDDWSTADSRIIQVIAVNDAPTLDLDADDSSTATGNDFVATWTENLGPVAIADVDAVLTDVDSTIQTLTVTITNLLSGADESLSATVPASISANYNSGIGVLTLTNLGTATNTEFETALRSVTYDNISEGTDGTPRIVQFVANDGATDSVVAQTTVNMVTVNDAPVLDLNGADGAGIAHSVVFTEGDAAVTVADTDATLTDVDNTTYESLTINLGGFVDGGQEMITIGGTQFFAGTPNSTSVTVGVTLFDVSFNGAQFSITLNGGGMMPGGDLQTLIRGVTYETTGDNPTDGFRSLDFVARDADAQNSITAQSLIDVNPLNDVPVVTLDSGSLVYTENAAPMILSPNALVSDADSTDFGGGTLTIDYASATNTISDFLTVRHVGDGAGQIGVSGSDVTFGGVVIGTIGIGSNDGAGGNRMVISLNANATQAGVEELVQNIAYNNSSENPTENPRDIQFTLTDGDGGTSTTVSRVITPEQINDAPAVSFFDNQTINEDTPLVLSIANGNHISISDPDIGVNAAQIQLSVTNGTLTLAQTTGLTDLFGNGTSTVTFRGALTDVNAALDGLTYDPAADYNGADVLVVQVGDQGDVNDQGTGGERFSSANVNIVVTPVNDAPTTTPVVLTAIAEDSGVRLITQAELLANANDVEDDGLTATGLTIAAGNGSLVDNGNGTWNYTPATNDDTGVSFSYTITDGTDNVAGSATLDITPVNDAPTTTPVVLTQIAEDSGVRVITQAELLANASDVEGDGLNATGLTIAVGNGSLVDNGNGTWNYTPAADDDTGVIFSYTITDGTDNVVGSASLDITPVNDAPEVDLDADDSSGTGGFDYNTTFTAGGGPVAIVDGPSIEDVDSVIQTLTVTISNNNDGALESVGYTLPANITAIPDLINGVFTFTNDGAASNADFQTLLNSLTYDNTSPTPETTTRTITVIASDGTNASAVATAFVGMSGDTSAPTVTNNIGSTVDEGSTDTIAATELTYTDDLQPAGSVNYTVTTATSNGFLALAASPTTPTTSFTQADIDSGNLIYVHDGSETTSDSFAFTVDDGQGNSLSGQVFNINVLPQNDAPENTVPGSQVTNEDTQLVFSVGNGNLLSVGDADAGAGNVEVTLGVANGTLTLSSTTGLTFSVGSGVSDATMTFQGNITDINTALDGLAYDPTLNYNGSDTLTILTNDLGNSGAGGAFSDFDSISLDVASINDAPTTSPVVLTPIAEDSGVRVITQAELLANANDVEGDGLTATGLTIAAGNGSLVDNGDGTWDYTPAADDDTNVSFNYTITDGAENVAGSATLDITPVNDAPTTSPVALTPIAEDSGVRVITQAELLANANDVDGDGLTATGLTIATGSGSLVDNGDGTWDYTPAADDDTSVSFNYTITDGAENVAGSATLDITPVNDAPTTSPVVLTPIAEDSGVRVITQAELLANANDVEGDGLTATGLTIAAGNGSLVDNGDGTWDYTPAADDDTSVSFNYTITDGVENVAGTATLDITPVNDAPTTSPVALTPIAEDSGVRVITQAELLANANDVDGDGLTATGLTIATGNGSLVDNGDGTWDYTPAADDDTNVSFNYTITDGAENVAGTATLDIAPVNDAPTTSLVVLTPIAEDSGVRVITQADLLANATDIDGDGLTAAGLTIAAGNGSLVDNGNGTWNYTPATNDNTSVSFNYMVTDGAENVAGTATLDITPVNDAPTTSPVVLTPIAEDSGVRVITQAELLANANDVEGDGLTATGLTIAAGNGILVDNGDGTWDYTPAADDDTGVSFNYTITDGTDNVAGAASLDITPVNDAPTTSLVVLTPIAEDSGVRVITQAELLANATDIDGDGLTATGLTIAAGNGSLVDNGNGTWNYTPATNDNTSVSFNYMVTDGAENVAGTATLDITPVNDAPTTSPVVLTPIAEDSGVRVITQAELLANASDVEGSVLTAAGLTIAAGNGSLIDNGDGTWNFTPAADDDTSVSFAYTISDGTDSVAGTATLDMTPVNDAPTVTVDATTGTYFEGTPIGIDPTVLLNDVDNATLEAAVISISGGHVPAEDALQFVDTPSISGTWNAVTGTLTLTGTASVADYQTALQSILYSNSSDAPTTSTRTISWFVDDGSELSNVATRDLAVFATNDSPVAQGENYSLDEGGTLSVGAPGLLANDSDVDGDALTLTIVNGPSNGTLVANPDGSFQYIHDGTETISDSFTYEVSDGNGGLSRATATLEIKPINDAPVATIDSYTVNEGATINITAPGLLANDTDNEGDPLTTTLVSGPTFGTLTLNADGSFTYTHDGSETTGDSFEYRINDGQGGVDTATVDIAITPVNDAPQVGSPTAIQSVLEDTSIVLSGANGNGLSISDVDAGNSPVLVTLTASDGTLTLSTTNGLTFGAGDGINDSSMTIVGTIADINYALDGALYTPVQDFTGSASIQIVVNDQGNFGIGGAKTNASRVEIVVNPANDLPEANDDQFTVDEGASVSGDLLANDVDVDADNLSAQLISGPANGTISLNGDGSFTYAHDGSETTSDSFTYQVDDGNGGTSTADVQISVDPVNDAPQAADDTFSSPSFQAIQVTGAGVAANDFDPDDTALITVLQNAPQNGMVNLASDGSFTYVPNPGFVGADSFTYWLRDPSGMGDVATVTINVGAPIVPAPTTDPGSGGNDGQEGSGTDTLDTEQSPDGTSGNDVEVNVISVGQPTVAIERDDAKERNRAQLELSDGQDELRRVTTSGSSVRGISADQEDYRIDLSAQRLSDSIEVQGDEENTAVSLAQQIVASEFAKELEELSQVEYLGEVALTAAASLATVAYLAWSIRSGYLAATMISSLPVWMRVDPLPILDFAAASRGRKSDEEALLPGLTG